jgi:predicted alpha/beta-hydrolase family hydrolase
MNERQVKLRTGRREMTAVIVEPDGAHTQVVVYAPGAGSNVNDRFGVYLSRVLAEAGVASVRFQFPYTEEGSRRPDPPSVTEAAWRVAVETARNVASTVIASGRSFGGRMASQAVAKGMPVAGLALFAYPLHPPKQPANLRDGHLGSVRAPTLFCSGTRDAFASPEELKAAASRAPNARVVLLEGADHGFGVLKSSGRTVAQVYQEAASALVEWLQTLPG